MKAAAVDDERRRQAALLEAIGRADAPLAALRLADGAAGSARALAAWRENALAVADKALRVVFPTVHRMLGDADFARLAGEYRAADPPTCGDLGAWGAGLPDFVETHAGLSDWPWLGDTARLDLALHRGERALDARFDAASMRLLHDVSPQRVRLVLVPGTTVIASRWPLAAIHAAHRVPDAGSASAFAALRTSIALRRGESVMIVREGWRATVQPLDAAGVGWVTSLVAGRPLSEALDRAGTAFDFAAWLETAVRRSWLEGVERVEARDDRRGGEA